MVFPIGLIRRLFSSKKSKSKRAVARRKSVKKARKPKTNGSIQLKRIVQYDKDYVNSGIVEAGNYTFELADFPDYLQFASLYEYYRIDKVKVDFRPMNNIATHGIVLANSPGTFTSMGRIHTVIDYNDSSNYPATRAGIQSAMKDDSYRCTTSNKNHSRTFVPKMFIEAAGPSVAAISRSKQWIPTGTVGQPVNSISHYCLKWLLEGGDGAGTTASFCVEPTVTMWVSFKDIKSQ